MAADASLLSFDGADELRRVLARAAVLPDAEYARMASSAAADGRLLDWDRHVDTLVGIYASLRSRDVRTHA